MKTTTFFSASLALAAVLSVATSAVAAPIMNLYYDPANGNLKLQNTTSGTQVFSSFDVLTLGNGSYGALSGLPGNVGYMSSGTVTLPTSPLMTSNTNPNGVNGLYSEVASQNTTAIMTLTPYAGWSTASPIGPVGSYWDLGNIAVTGMTQADLDTRFLTVGEISPGGVDLYGQFLFSYQTSPGVFSVLEPGDVVALAPIPEPSTLAIAAVAAGFGGVGAVSRRRKKAAANARSLSINA